MDLKNITMTDLKEKLATIDKKILIKFGAGFGYDNFIFATSRLRKWILRRKLRRV